MELGKGGDIQAIPHSEHHLMNSVRETNHDYFLFQEARICKMIGKKR